MEADEANNVKDIVIEEANGALGGEVSSSVDVSLNESTPVANGNGTMESPRLGDSPDGATDSDVPEIELIIKVFSVILLRDTRFLILCFTTNWEKK